MRPVMVVGRFLESGGVFKLEFGPKAFIVVSDPVVVRYLLKVTNGPTADAQPHHDNSTLA